MNIILSPTAAFEDDTPPTLKGSILTYRGQDFDITDLPEDAPVQLVNGDIVVQYRYSMETAEDNQPLDWGHYTFAADEPITCPIVRRKTEEDADPLP